MLDRKLVAAPFVRMWPVSGAAIPAGVLVVDELVRLALVANPATSVTLLLLYHTWLAGQRTRGDRYILRPPRPHHLLRANVQGIVPFAHHLSATFVTVCMYPRFRYANFSIDYPAREIWQLIKPPEFWSIAHEKATEGDFHFCRA